jgi:hypothetical protein
MRGEAEIAEDQNIGAPGPAGPGPQPSEPAAVPESAFPGPGTGAEPAAFGGYAPDGGVPAPALPPWRRTRVRVITGIIAVLAVLGFVLQHLASTGATGSVRLPGTLLGVRENTSPAARAFDRTLVTSVGAPGKVLHLVAGYYGVQPGAGLAGFGVVSGGLCGTCAPRSAAGTLRFYRTRFPGARLFPPGPNGGTLVCAPVPAQGAPSACWWFDEKTSGLVIYLGGSASGLADAAAKTSQIRAAVEQ